MTKIFNIPSSSLHFGGYLADSVMVLLFDVAVDKSTRREYFPLKSRVKYDTYYNQNISRILALNINPNQHFWNSVPPHDCQCYGGLKSSFEILVVGTQLGNSPLIGTVTFNKESNNGTACMEIDPTSYFELNI